MSDQDQDEHQDQADTNMHTLTSTIVAAYVGNHAVAITEIPGLITIVYGALNTAISAQDVSDAPRTPAVPIRKSVYHDALVCLECGHKLKVLRRHLHTNHGMTVGDYKSKWRLPQEYPTVAPDYAKQRSALAVARGLGRRR